MKTTVQFAKLALLAALVLTLALPPSLALARDEPLPAAAPATIQLLPPALESGASLMRAIERRRSSREFDRAPLSLQALSDVLWVAGGYNRPESKGLVIPTAMGSKELDVYALLPEGIYRYEPGAHRLALVTAGDHRAQAGQQPFVAEAPLNLFFVADEARMRARDAEARQVLGAMTAAYASENVYLYCAAAGLVTVARGSFDAKALARLLALAPGQKLYLGQSVGRPKAKARAQE